MKRRERTRQLIELGGLVVKAGLVELADDDRAVLFGAFLTVAARLNSNQRDDALTLWRRRGKRTFAETRMSDDAQVTLDRRDSQGIFRAN